MNKKSGTGFNRLRNAFGWSMAGLKASLINEKSFQQELVLCVLCIPLALLLAGTALEKALLIASLFFVLIVEILNSAIEAAVDLYGEKRHELAGRAKDMGSAAVFLALVNAAVVWLLVFFF